MPKFVAHFKKIVTEAASIVQPPQQGPVDDSQVFAQSFDSDQAAQQLDKEVVGAGLDPEQRASILKRADHYASKIDSIILPTLRKLQDDIVTGVFASIAPDVKGISGINEDLAKLAESLRGRTRDAILKSDKNEKKQ
jgi:hypothetical protein